MLYWLKSLPYLFIPIAKAVEDDKSDPIESIEKTSRLINEYGVEIVILSVFIVIFISILIYMVIMNHKLFAKVTEDDGVNNETLIKEVVTACVASIKETEAQMIKDSMQQTIKEEKERHKEAIQSNLNAYAIFEEATKVVMKKFNCQRIAIYLLHNGNETPYGYPFAKATCIYEYTTKGPLKTIRGKEHNSVPLYAFSKLIEHLIDYDECLVDSLEEYPFKTPETKEQFADFVAGSRITSLYVLAIKDNSGIIAAFTTVEFDSAEKLHQHSYKDFKESVAIMNAAIKPIVIDRGFVSGYEHPSYPENNEEYK